MSGRTRNADSGRASVALAPGDVVGDKYRIDRVLGVGGMGVVFLARHIELDGLVALKFLSAEYLASADAIGRFRREAQAAVKLRSEHVVRVFDVGTHSSGRPYMVMEYLEGFDLANRLDNGGPLPPSVAVDLMLQTCDAVADAHDKGIIHRDLKPSNLFCIPRSDGRLTIKVLDFGISKVTGGLSSSARALTGTGNVVGSPSYMSPEQMKTPNRVDARTDIWSLGVVLYESLTGQPPFPASTYAEICLRVHQDPPVPIDAYGADIAPGLQAVVMKCLDKNPDRRYATALELAAALTEFAPVSARPTSEPVRAPELLGSAPRRVTPSDHRGRSDTITFWAQTAQSLSTRMRARRFLLAGGVLMVMVLGGGWYWLRDDASVSDSPSGEGQPGVSTVIAPLSQRSDTERPEHAPAAAEQISPTGSMSSGATPAEVMPPEPIAAPLPRAPVAPTAERRPATTPSASVARPAAAANKALTSPTAGHANPRTERDPRSSTWTR